MLPRSSSEIEQGYGLKSYVAVIGNRERNAIILCKNKIIIPFFDTGGTLFDVVPVIDLIEFS